MAKIDRKMIELLEPIELAIVCSAVGGMTEKDLDAYDERIKGIKSWIDLTQEEKDKWDNNKSFWESMHRGLDWWNLTSDEFIEIWWENVVTKLIKYLKEGNLKAMVLGLSGGIDSTLAAAIGAEVEKRCSIPLIGVSLPLKNKPEEISGAEVTGKAWCAPGNFFTFPIEGIYEQFQLDLQMFAEGYNSRGEKLAGEDAEDTNLRIGKTTPIANGNIAARIRMTLLYHMAGIKKGLTLGTGNKTENLLGFFTIHGDEPMDYSLFPDLWKTEVYKTVEWILRTRDLTDDQKKSLEMALKITPTDGNGISDSDLHQILGEELAEKMTGREGYELVDEILDPRKDQTQNIDEEVRKRVLDRVKKNEFKQAFIL